MSKQLLFRDLPKLAFTGFLSDYIIINQTLCVCALLSFFMIIRLYQYIHGANLNSTQLAMTAPVLTAITEAPHGSSFSVKMSLSAYYEGTPPQPNSELDLQLEKWRAKCIAIRKFSGFARDDNISEEVEALGASLNEHWNGTLESKSSYTIAQYNASNHLSGRFNEVWMAVSGQP